MLFKKETLSELVGCRTNEAFENFTILVNEITDYNRWSKLSEMVFRDNNSGKFYISFYYYSIK